MIESKLPLLMARKRQKIVDLARDTGINRGTITRLYHGTAKQIDLDVLDVLCRYFGCRVEDILEFKDPVN